MTLSAKLWAGLKGMRALRKISKQINNCPKCQRHVIANAQRMQKEGQEYVPGARGVFGEWLKERLCEECKQVLEEQTRKVAGIGM